MTKAVDLNSDMGESDREIDRDYCILNHVTSANIACGFHAGDPYTMLRVAQKCSQLNVGIGAHPSFQDRANFGRTRVEMKKEELVPLIIYQIGALEGICRSIGRKVFHVKPHGALYNMAADEDEYAEAVVEAARIMDKSILTLPSSKLMEKAINEGVKAFAEGFADRGYLSDGRLAPRGMASSLITEPDVAAERALRLVDGSGIKSVDGLTINIQVQSICIHSDTPNACKIAETVRRRLEEAGVRVVSLSEM
ncbi:MAG: 5-oxoprolinase subunit PxpA [Conexivisphaerales archaeon]